MVHEKGKAGIVKEFEKVFFDGFPKYIEKYSEHYRRNDKTRKVECDTFLDGSWHELDELDISMVWYDLAMEGYGDVPERVIRLLIYSELDHVKQFDPGGGGVVVAGNN